MMWIRERHGSGKGKAFIVPRTIFKENDVGGGRNSESPIPTWNVSRTGVNILILLMNQLRCSHA